MQACSQICSMWSVFPVFFVFCDGSFVVFAHNKMCRVVITRAACTVSHMVEKKCGGGGSKVEG